MTYRTIHGEERPLADLFCWFLLTIVMSTGIWICVAPAIGLTFPAVKGFSPIDMISSTMDVNVRGCR